MRAGEEPLVPKRPALVGTPDAGPMGASGMPSDAIRFPARPPVIPVAVPPRFRNCPTAGWVAAEAFVGRIAGFDGRGARGEVGAWGPSSVSIVLPPANVAGGSPPPNNRMPIPSARYIAKPFQQGTPRYAAYSISTPILTRRHCSCNALASFPRRRSQMPDTTLAQRLEQEVVDLHRCPPLEEVDADQ